MSYTIQSTKIQTSGDYEFRIYRDITVFVFVSTIELEFFSGWYEYPEFLKIKKLIIQILNNKKYAILYSKNNDFFIRELCKLVLQNESIKYDSRANSNQI